MTLHMVDSIESPQTTGQPIPSLIKMAPVVAAYVAGNSWPTFGPYSKARPDLVAADRIVSITLTARAVARCLDVESGGATASQAPAWWRMSQPHFKVPVWIYTFASNAANVVNAMSAAGIKRDQYYLWIADFDFAPSTHIDPKYGVRSDGKQYSDKGAGNCDLSLIEDYMVGPPPPPPDPHHYLFYDTTTRLLFGGRYNELAAVKAYDKLRAQGLGAGNVRVWVQRAKCNALAGRIWAVAHMPGKGGWAVGHRAWRWIHLRRRFKGQIV